MTSTEDIASDQEPEAADCCPPASVPSASARPLRGHQAKIAEAVAALRAEGKLPPQLRPGHRDRLVTNWLIAAGYGELAEGVDKHLDDLPSPRALRRYFEREAEMAI